VGSADGCVPHEEFILGFIAGEGCFDTHITETKTGNVNISSRFKVEVKTNDVELLKKMADYINAGVVRERSGKDLCGWLVENKKDLKRIMNFVENNKNAFQKSAKYESYKTWKKIVEIYCDGRGMSVDGKEKCIKLAKETNKNGYTGESSEYWINKLNNE